jgi:hypothetical protein
MTERFKKGVLPLVIGVVGVVLALAAYHSYVDHNNLHLLMRWGVNMEQRLKAANIK